MMPLAVESAFCDPTSAAMIETPSKKRKRIAETNPFLNFSEQTFSIPSSTPIHNREIDGSAFENPSFRMANKENYNLFSDSCMEVKSIADLAGSNAVKRPLASVMSDANPFEVVRKAPKKKKKQLHPNSVALEESCFENPCLNLAAADKQPLNPFEVPRDGDESKRKAAEEESRCFVNNALNIRGPENGEQRFNPFEIMRPKDPATVAPVRSLPVPDLTGIENPAMEMPTYAIAVPFTPSLKHRINFQELAPTALTPCQMMANMVVCSPDPSKVPSVTTGDAAVGSRNSTVTLAKRRSLSVINEESDIGEKLDCYQLELENSINEAKARKQRQGETTPFSFSGTGHRRRSVRRSLIDMKHISNLSQKLHDLEDEENEITKLPDDEPEEILPVDEENKENKEPSTPILKKETTANDMEKTEVTDDEQTSVAEPHHHQMTFTITKETTVREEIRINVSNPDVQFEEVDDFEDEEQDVELLHNPAPFQRAYRKKEPFAVMAANEFKRPTSISQESRENAPVKSHKVREAIRRSFRRLIPKGQPHTEEPYEADSKPTAASNGSEGHGFISSIRHSLRRRQPKTSECTAEEKPLDMSIIVEQPRAVFRQPSLDQYKSIAAASSGGGTLRSSLRRSTKDIRKQMMKSVFRKQSGDLDANHGQHVGQLI